MLCVCGDGRLLLWPAGGQGRMSGRLALVECWTQDAYRAMPHTIRRVSLREIELVGTNAHVCEADLPEAVRLLSSRREGWADIAPEAFPLDELLDEGIVPLAERRANRIKTLIDPWAADRRPTDTVPR